MLAGNPNRRTYDASSFADQAISFVCLDYYNSHAGDPAWEQRSDFFQHNCPDGMRAQIFFPSCVSRARLSSAVWKVRNELTTVLLAHVCSGTASISTHPTTSRTWPTLLTPSRAATAPPATRSTSSPSSTSLCVVRLTKLLPKAASHADRFPLADLLHRRLPVQRGRDADLGLC
jgi:hypothetical protein